MSSSFESDLAGRFAATVDHYFHHESAHGSSSRQSNLETERAAISGDAELADSDTIELIAQIEVQILEKGGIEGERDRLPGQRKDNIKGVLDL